MAPTKSPKAPDGLPVPHSFAAEDSASAVLARIVKKGGDQLYEKYLDRKSYEFTRDVVTTNATCLFEMHNPTHEDKDTDDEWALEADPPPLGSDSWSRMAMPRPAQPAGLEEVVEETEMEKVLSIGGVVRNVVRRMKQRSVHRRASSSASDSQNSSFSAASRSGTHSSKTSKANDHQMPNAHAMAMMRVPSMGMKPLRDHRAWVIRDDWVADEDEDKLRLAMVRDEQRRIIDAEEQRQERLDEEAAVAAEERRRMVDALDMRPRTYDVDGRIIWIQEPDPELLPNVQALAEIEIESRETDFQAIVPNFQSMLTMKAPLPPKEVVVSPKNKNRRNTKEPLRRSSTKKTQEESVFTDTFYKPDYMQPPIIETMKVKPGVVLGCMGSVREGPNANRGQIMTRKEYIRQKTREDRPALADGAGSSSASDGDTAETATKENAKKERPSSAPGGGRDWKSLKRQTTDPAPKADGSGAKSDVDLTKLVQSHGPSAPKPLVFIGGSAEDNAKAPPAPAWSVRNTGRALKMDARPPRFHVSPLGACLRSGPVQPPLGATMGHGLLRNGSLKDDYYFPSGLTSPMAAGAPSSPASTRGPPSGRDLPSRRPSSAMSRTNSEPALPRGQLWAAAVPGVSASITASPSSGRLRPASAARPASASRPTSASRTRPASASGRRCAGSAQGTPTRIKAR